MTTPTPAAPDGDDDALFVFAEEPAPAAQRIAAGEKPWKILIADDDDEIHAISMMVLKDFHFEGRPLEFFSAHSGAAAKQLVAEHPDAAILLLDVVMETDDAGLDVVRHVRQELKNPFVRIILRTGQPGQAPERSVVIDYDINDYKEKTELTAQKLVTTVVSALRAFRDMQTIEASRKGLEKIIAASRNLFEPQSLSQFSVGVLCQVTSLLRLGDDSLYVQAPGFAVKREAENFRVIAGTGQYAEAANKSLENLVPADVLDKLHQACHRQQTLIDDTDYVGYFKTSTGTENLVYLQTNKPISPLDLNLLRVLASNIAIAFDNVYLNEELTHTQIEIIYTLGEVVESRSEETGRHVFRVGECAYLLGRLIALDQRDCDLLRLAAPMHDLGKIGIPDAVLHKAEQLTAEEFELMRTHAAIGHRILKGSDRLPLRSAAIIAHQHHERWDGTGYPLGLKGEEIHIFGRIVGLVDVFDALAHDRCYKKAWPIPDVVDYIRKQRGTQLDPHLVDVFLAHQDEFIAILRDNPNQPARPAD